MGYKNKLTDFKALIALALFLVSLLKPLPTNSEISITNRNNFSITTENMELVIQAIYRLAGDSRLVNHPIRDYLYNPDLSATIAFDQGMARTWATALQYSIFILHNNDMAYYLEALVHEFIHVAMNNKYVNTANYSFLRPEDFAFQYLMEEAFALAVDFWAHLSYPERNNDRQIRNWEQQASPALIADAMRNDYIVQYPNLGEEQINGMVAAKMLDIYMTSTMCQLKVI